MPVNRSIILIVQSRITPIIILIITIYNEMVILNRGNMSRSRPSNLPSPYLSLSWRPWLTPSPGSSELSAISQEMTGCPKNLRGLGTYLGTPHRIPSMTAQPSGGQHPAREFFARVDLWGGESRSSLADGDWIDTLLQILRSR